MDRKRLHPLRNRHLRTLTELARHHRGLTEPRVAAPRRPWAKVNGTSSREFSRLEEAEGAVVKGLPRISPEFELQVNNETPKFEEMMNFESRRCPQQPVAGGSPPFGFGHSDFLGYLGVSPFVILQLGSCMRNAG